MRLLLSTLVTLSVALLVVSPGVLQGAGGGAAGLAASTAPMQVSLRLAQDPLSTPLDSLALVATVTSEGRPVPDANVTFNDAHNSSFNVHGSTASTNSSGVAVASVRLFSPFPGNDTMTASATAPGYDAAKGTVVVYVIPFGIQQLAVTATVTNGGAPGGSSEVIQGYVGTVDSSSSNVIANVGAFWSPAITGVSGASVTLADSIGSAFSSRTVTTNNVGFYSANLTLAKTVASVTDIVTVSASRATYNGSESTIALAVNPYAPRSLTVTLDSFYPPTYSTVLDSATIQARISAGGSPVAGVPVTFSDSLGSLFQGQVATTDSSGSATTVVYFDAQSTGLDLFTARTSENGSSPGAGSNTLTVRPAGNAQLSVTASVTSTAPLVGASERVSGKVGWVATSMMYAWTPTQSPVSGARVVISDSRGSFPPLNVSTDGSGIYSGTFIAPDTGGAPDVIEVSASGPGYRGSTSALFIVPVPGQDPGGSPAANATTSSSASSATSTSTAPPVGQGAPPNQTQAGSTTPGSAENPPLPPPWTVVGIATGALAAATLVVYRVARLGKKGRPPSG